MLVHGQELKTEENRRDVLHRKILRVTTLRNRQLGLWAAYMMEMDNAEDYADQIVSLGLQRGGDVAIADKLVADFAEAGMDITAEAICLEMAQRTLSAERHLSRSPDLLQAA